MNLSRDEKDYLIQAEFALFPQQVLHHTHSHPLHLIGLPIVSDRPSDVSFCRRCGLLKAWITASISCPIASTRSSQTARARVASAASGSSAAPPGSLFGAPADRGPVVAAGLPAKRSAWKLSNCSAATSYETLPQILELQWTEKTAPIVATISFLQSSMAKHCFDEQWARDYSCANYQDPAPQDTPPVAAQPCPLNSDPEPQQPKPGCPLGKKKRKRHIAETDPAKAH